MSAQRQDVTQALVLAAGRGSRISHSSSKPLFPILGVPLLARTLFTLKEAGITDAYVVVGYEGQRVRKKIEGIQRLDLRVHWIDNPRWEEPNGVSVLSAEADLAGPFIMTMADHLFEATAVRRLMAQAHEVEGLALVVDERIDEVHDLDDATKVRLDGDRITDVGKTLTEFDAIDTGVFLATPALFQALRSVAGPQNGPSLSDGVRRLAQDGRALAVDGTDLPWQDVDTPADARVAEQKLLSRWPKPTDGPVARYLNRPLSKAITRYLVRTPVTPNQISVATLLLGLASAGFAAAGGYTNWVLSGLLFQVASVLDGSDGELAVLTYRASDSGAWVDTVCDNVSYLAFLIGLTVGAYRAELPTYFVWGGVVGLAATAVSLANINFYLLRRRKSGSALTVRYGYETGGGVFRNILRVLHYFGKRDLISLLVLLLALVGQLPAALPVFGVGATLLLLPGTTKANVSLYLRTRRLAGARSRARS